MAECGGRDESSLHISRRLILIGFLKIIKVQAAWIERLKGRLKNKKQPAQPRILNPNSRPVLSPVGES